MLPDARFLKQPTAFWAAVRAISEQIGYAHKFLTVPAFVDQLQRVECRLSVKPVDGIALPCSIEKRDQKDWIAWRGPMDTRSRDALLALDGVKRNGWAKAINLLYERSNARAWIDCDLLLSPTGDPTPLGKQLCDYLNHRQERLGEIERLLMDKQKAETTFNKVRKELKSDLVVPQNKQTGEKSGPAYLTGIVNMLIDAHINGLPCDYDPQSLATFLSNGKPVTTMARRLDGAFPRTVNPIAVWEIKEYYNSTTFGSRVAGGVYETTLDGMELKELLDAENIRCRHYVFVDDYHTWWNQGRSYLCRFIDLLHMGLVDEVIFGTEVVDRVPKLAREWVSLVRARESKKK